MAARTGRRYNPIFVPMAERFTCNVEVTDIVAAGCREINWFFQRAVERVNRVVQQFNNILWIVGESAGVFDGVLIVIGGFQQIGCKRLETIIPYGLVLINCAITVRINEEIRIGVWG